ncbi:MAG: potassium-transporting ATPase subunit KdpC [Phycisphaerales bacterium]
MTSTQFDIVRQLRPAVATFAALSLLTGLAYPLIVTGIAQVALPGQANGSLLRRDGAVVGSRLVGQARSSPGRFWARPSATAPRPYTAFDAATGGGSGGSNLAPTNPALVDAVAARIAALHDADAAAGYARPADQLVPVDLVTSSASGLDPHISRAAAEYQVPRVARALGRGEDEIRRLVEAHTQRRQIGVFGEPTVNVVELNLALDADEAHPAR